MTTTTTVHMNEPANKAVQDIYPLSPTQQGLLFHTLSQTDAGAYVVQVSYTLKGELNHQAFDQSWQQLANRHTILRSAFVWKNIKAPVQVVGRQVSVPIYWHRWEAFDANAQQRQLLELLASDRATGFNLSHAPLMRINAIQLGSHHYQIIWTHHHILLDGWSLPKLLKEWVIYYQAACEQIPTDQTASILGKAYPYREYIAWLQKQDITAARQFWKMQLSGLRAPTPLGIAAKEIATEEITNKGTAASRTEAAIADAVNIGTDGSESSVAETTFHRAEQHHELSAQFTKQLKAFAKQNRLTLSTLVQGTWAKVLSVYSGNDEVVYGLACAGRPQTLEGAEQRVGLFINTLPMRVKLDGALVPWLRSIQTQQLAQQPYEYTPLIEIQAESNIHRQSPLFESVVVFENYPLESVRAVEGLEILKIEIIEQTHYPLALFAAAADTLNLKILYDARRFSQQAIAHLIHHLNATLQGMLDAETVASPQPLIEKLSILPKTEKQQIISFGQGPTVNLLGSMCVHTAIAHRAKQTPQATALIFEGDSLSYQQLNSRANQLAHYLLNSNAQMNAPVGLCVERSIDMIVTLLAILKAGCAYVPLDPTYPDARLRHIIEDAGVTHLICHAATASVVATASLNRTNISQQSDEISVQPTSEPSVNNSLSNLAYLIYTSGSTGKPKGVPITHQSLTNLLNSMAARLHITATDTLMAVTTLAFDIAALELFLPLTTGACLLLASSQTARDAHKLIAYLDTYGVDIMQATPATWRLLLGGGWGGQNGLRILCGGEALDAALARRLLNCGEEVWNVYGPTETTIWSSALALTSDMLIGGSVPIGDPIDNTQLYVLDEKQQIVPIGVAGELYIGGAGLSEGYWQREDLTGQRFVSVLVDSDWKTLYRTGDRVRYRKDGSLDYLGRLDYQTKLRGYRIELGEIERVLTAYPQVSQAVAVVQGEAEKQQLVAYVTLAPATGTQSLIQELRSHLTHQLPHYMLPAAYQVLEAFPLTPNGKIDRNALPALSSDQAALTPESRPKTAIENTLLAIWQSLLPAQAISIHDNFFEIGGHSLIVISAQDRIRQQLAVELSLVDLFRYPTVRSLALYISQAKISQVKINQAKARQQEEQNAPTVHSRTESPRLAAGKQRLRQRLTKKQSLKQSSKSPTIMQPTVQRPEEEAE